MKIIETISNTRLLILMTALLMVSGISAFMTLPRAEDPVIINRYANITTSFPGASAERVETLVTEVIENKLRELSEVKLVSSTSRPSVSIVTLELNDTITEPEPVWSQARDKLSDIESILPAGAHSPDLDSDHTYAFTTIASLTWSGAGEPDRLTLGRYAKELAKRLRTLSGTEFVDEYGMPQEEIQISLRTADAAALGRSSGNIAESLEGADAKNSAGELVSAYSRFGLEIESELDSIERIKQVPIATDSSGHIIRMEDIASVKRGEKTPQDQIAIIDGEPGVIVAARMHPDLRVDNWTSRANALIGKFEQELPSNVKVTVLFNQQGYTETRLDDLGKSLMIGFGLILIVLFVTLGVRAAILVAISLPLTSLLTLSIMKMTGVPINQMSVTGLIVALGIMVDNAVVMVDTIQAYRLKGQQRAEATMNALKHLWVPLLGSTLTTVLAFAPIILMPGASGEFVGGIAITVSFSLIGSYIISHTLIAGLATKLLPKQLSDVDKKGQHHWYMTGLRIPALTRWFSASVRFGVTHPIITIALVLLVPFTGYWSMSQLTEQFFPPSDRDMFEIQVYMPPQASIYATKNTSEKIDDIIHRYPEVERIDWLVGANFPSFYYNLQARQNNAPYFSQAMVKTENFDQANALIPQLQKVLDEEVPEAQILVRKLNQGPPFTAPVELRVYGENLDTLKAIGEDVRLILAGVPHVTHTRETLQPGTPKVWLKVDEDTAKLNGISLNQFAGMLQTTLTGRESGSVIEGSESVPIRVRVADEARENLAHLSNIRLPISSDVYSTGINVSTLAELELTTSRGAITRRNGQRVNTIEGYIEAGVLPQTVLNEFQKRLESYQMPSGYTIGFGGESAERDNSVNSLISNVAVVVVLMVLVVVMSFNSFRMSSIIFMVAGLAGGLGLLSVWTFGYPFGFTVIIAMLGIAGLAINAAIVILTELKLDKEASSGNVDAVVEAVMSCTRHISSTTITTVGGFMPLIIAGGGFWPPFAVAIVGGTVLTTLISFYFVPVVYHLMTKNQRKKVVTVTA
ncbi:efflux RND transporter permease subunit [Vibrio sp. 10N.261.46.E12]|uniref:efflux RND transporter permease subunit n=1 Tax=unclassified Vibrio TaxID=2614977 RepID=UPI000978395A|nr:MULTISPECIES: efflux RND transporter permease subunit [unclassified Vibrio]OMO36657.1 acriflavin resistance protein [Vibrio sp. 10N.261.45.E1]PMJ27520.1 acriflavin resistance protein [Vibrio sp. 10N.286.45.B6]PML87937.1 acriflavin resistance protein [Vibrio sp. 10N.261.49.E11]PMM64784.1 acriflavin resistance protein [Vibrio sp. 10N.261.46.F12]PMM84403.1 acriflavin resistance protein [Vibrio sp. 10N.261.46.E8]